MLILMLILTLIPILIQVHANSAIVDSFVRATLGSEGATEALDRLEELYNMHGEPARASPVTLLSLLDAALRGGDVYVRTLYRLYRLYCLYCFF